MGRGPGCARTSGRLLWEQPAHGFELLAKRWACTPTCVISRCSRSRAHVQLLLSDAAADDEALELFLVSLDAAALEPLFDALSRTAELNPDSDDESDTSRTAACSVSLVRRTAGRRGHAATLDAMLAGRGGACAPPGFAGSRGNSTTRRRRRRCLTPVLRGLPSAVRH